jgi:hypothetical protein
MKPSPAVAAGISAEKNSSSQHSFHIIQSERKFAEEAERMQNP